MKKMFNAGETLESKSCTICQNLRAESRGSWTLHDLKSSRTAGCKSCAILYDGLIAVRESWPISIASPDHPSHEITVRWDPFPYDKSFKIKIFDSYRSTLGADIMLFQFHSAPDEHSEWEAIRPAGMVTPDSSSNECIAKIQHWLHECIQKHPKCNRTSVKWNRRLPVPPKRLIDVGSTDQNPRLIENTLIRDYYLTLSHCWGLSHPITTTRSTLAQRRNGIPIEELPPTFRDAVLFTRMLGIRYLWIDSLCIVQDDEKDWLQESGRMADIYGSSYLTIAATAARDSSKGMFSVRRSATPVPGSSEHNPRKVFVSKAIDHSAFGLRASEPPTLEPSWDSRQTMTEKFPLFQRAWCVQERLLSNRILHFTSSELVWQCRTCDRCECDSISSRNTARSIGLLTLRSKFNKVLEGDAQIDIWVTWREIVEDYCSTQLTMEKDLLPALSGVAAKFGLAGAGTYIAGLWHKPGALILGSSPLFLDLLWKSDCRDARRPQPVKAPSFSWASRLGAIRYRSDDRNDSHRDRRTLRKCIFVTKIENSSDPFNQFADLPGAAIELRGQLLPCRLSIRDEVAWLVLDEFAYLVTIDIWEEATAVSNVELFCLPVVAYQDINNLQLVFDGLLLAKVRSDSFRRLGLVERVSQKLLDEAHHPSFTLL